VTYRVCFVCTGNICRSPSAEVVLRRLLAEAGLDGQVTVDSAGLGDWHVGEGADRRTVAALSRRGYDARQHCARQFRAADFAERDLVVALDAGHLRELRALAPTAADRDKVRLLRSYDPEAAQGSGDSGCVSRSSVDADGVQASVRQGGGGADIENIGDDDAAGPLPRAEARAWASGVGPRRQRVERHTLDVPDPYYGGEAGFEHVLDLVESACRGLLDEVRHAVGASRH
jgi:protein-tyrosine phosphatase